MRHLWPALDETRSETDLAGIDVKAIPDVATGDRGMRVTLVELHADGRPLATTASRKTRT